MPADALSDKELRRYQRQIILPEIGEEGQEKLKRSRVLIIGVGGLGTPILQYLSAGGIGKIGIADYDMVNESNLQRQILFGSRDLGKLKAIIARERIMDLNPDVDLEIINLRVSRENIMKLIEEYDLVFDATDNFATRYLINDACVISGKPWIYGGISTFEGQVSVFNYRGGPTLRCLYPNQPQEGSYRPASESGIIGVLPGMIGCYQASEALKLICGYGDLLSGKMLSINIRNNTFRIFKFSPIEKNLKIKKLQPEY